ncbi:MAG: hypothetical protein ACPL3C_11245 [Pyrobaculum sp.]
MGVREDLPGGSAAQVETPQARRRRRPRRGGQAGEYAEHQPSPDAPHTPSATTPGGGAGRRLRQPRPRLPGGYASPQTPPLERRS